MRVTLSKSRSQQALITLGRGEKALWQTATADGRDIDSARRTVIAKARGLLEQGRRVTVVAPMEAGGWTAEEWAPGDLGTEAV